MKKSTKNIASTVRELIAPTAESLGLILWDVEYVKEGTEWYLRVTIDTEEGVTIEDCEKMHRAIDPLLDEADPIENSYHLEVCSPGLERELKTDFHFAACVGEPVEVRLFAPMDGSKSFCGILAPIEDDCIRIEDEGGIRAFPRAAVARVQTLFDFDGVEE
ncbi:MAG: ribosome maturation factor RimP [Ruminococcaceae bacterium]|nr:ribosome maturation factor RimP [Oscillospiraceae bacterium]